MEKLNYKIILILFIFLFVLTGCKKNNENIQQENICSVTFDVGNETLNYIVQVEKGDKVTKPKNPIRNGYQFIGWYCQDELWSFIGYFVTEDIILTAKWEIIEYSIEYENLENSTNPNPCSYNVENNEITLKEPIRKGYKFLGWYYQDELYNNIDCSIAKDITSVSLSTLRYSLLIS